MTALYHYTCTHGRAALGDAGWVTPTRIWNPEAAASIPEAHAWMGSVVWFTDLACINRRALGLTMMHTDCDRMTARYLVADSMDVRRWLDVQRDLAPPQDRWRLNLAQGAMPAHWYVSKQPVPVLLDRSYERVGMAVL